MHRSPFKSSAEYWSAQVCEKISKAGKSPWKGVDGKIPRPYKVLGNIPAFTIQSGKLSNKLSIR